MTRREAWKFAQQRVAKTGEQHEIYVHVGRYGDPRGDIEATHDYAIRPLGREISDVWALVGVVNSSDLVPEGVRSWKGPQFMISWD